MMHAEEGEDQERLARVQVVDDRDFVFAGFAPFVHGRHDEGAAEVLGDRLAVPFQLDPGRVAEDVLGLDIDGRAGRAGDRFDGLDIRAAAEHDREESQ